MKTKGFLLFNWHFSFYPRFLPPTYVYTPLGRRTGISPRNYPSHLWLINFGITEKQKSTRVGAFFDAKCKVQSYILLPTRGDLISLPPWGRWREQSERRMRFIKLVSATSSVLLRNPPSPKGKGYECIRRSYVPSPSCFAIHLPLHKGGFFAFSGRRGRRPLPVK